jgi:hypothetical protein
LVSRMIEVSHRFKKAELFIWAGGYEGEASWNENNKGTNNRIKSSLICFVDLVRPEVFTNDKFHDKNLYLY